MRIQPRVLATGTPSPQQGQRDGAANDRRSEHAAKRARIRAATAYHREVPGPNANSTRHQASLRRARSPTALTRQLARFATAQATSVGRWLASQRRRHIDVGVRSKEVGDPVTDLDIAGERRLRAAIEEHWPQHGFVGEETGTAEVGRSHVWIVDPIDGTANFARGLQPWGVSVACLRDGEPIVGAVYAYPEDVTVVATHGEGVRAGRTRLRMPVETRLDADSVVSAQWFRGGRHLSFLTKLVSTGTRIRVFGCTVVQLCDVARGRLHANVQQQGRIWDIAAAGLIVQESGGKFTGWNGLPIFPCSAADLQRHHASVAASPGIHGQLVRLLQGVAVS